MQTNGPASRRALQTLSLPAAAWGMYRLGDADFGGSPVSAAAWTAFTAYCFFCLTSLFHECAHEAWIRWPAANRWLGRFLGTAMGVPYTAYRECHALHHAELNRPGDWELWPYSDPRASLAFRRAFVWIDLVLGFLTAPYIYGRIFWVRGSPLALAARQVRKAIALEYAGWALTWGAILAGTIGWGSPEARADFVRCWLAPLWLAGVLQTGRKLTEHLGLADSDARSGARTVDGPGWLTRSASFLNFDIFLQGPHHRHGSEDAARLRRRIRAEAWPVYPSYGRAVAAMLRHLWRSPGVGANAGSPPP